MTDAISLAPYFARMESIDVSAETQLLEIERGLSDRLRGQIL
ncbi:MAG: hypothetical protein WDO73_17015 [Ignavibacteriota bacterium]